MKTVKTLLAILFVGSVFVACENDTINDELTADEIENVEINASEDDEEVNGPRHNNG